MRQIRQQVRFCWGNDGNELRARLDEAIMRIDPAAEKVDGRTIYDVYFGGSHQSSLYCDFNSLAKLQFALNEFMREASRVAYEETWGENP